MAAPLPCQGWAPRARLEQEPQAAWLHIHQEILGFVCSPVAFVVAGSQALVGRRV